MSLEILLVPAALAAYNLWKASADPTLDRDRQQHVATVETRLRDPELLVTSLHALGGTAHLAGDRVVGTLDGVPITFSRNADGLAVAHVDTDQPDVAEHLILRLDAEYASAVQTRMYDRLIARASAMGLTIESETVHDDNSITVTLLTGSTPS